MPRKIPPALGATLRFLRFSRGWTGGDLAKAVQASPPLISDYEKGVKTLSRERLEDLVDPMNVPPEAIDAALLALELLDPDLEVPPNPGDLTPEERRRIVRAAARIGAGVAREIRTGLTAAVRAGRLEEDRRLAGEVWSVLRQLAPKERRTVVDVAGEHLGWAVCERLCEESEKAGADKAERAVELAELALRVAERTPGPESDHLQGYAWAFLGNARRVQGNLPGADEAFLCSARFWNAAKPAGRPTPLDEVRLLDLEASLRKYQGRFEEALDLLDRALSRTEDAGARVRILIKQATTLELQGAYQQAVLALEEAISLLKGSGESRLHLGIRFNLAVNLLHLSRNDEAAGLLPHVRNLAFRLGNTLDSVRVLWLEGRLESGLGNRKQAIAALTKVREELTSREIAYDAALACLELAVLYLDEKRTGEVKALARQMIWIFSAQGVHREALAALRLFCEAAEHDTVTVDLVKSILGYLERARHLPNLPFVPGPDRD